MNGTFIITTLCNKNNVISLSSWFYAPQMLKKGIYIIIETKYLL